MHRSSIGVWHNGDQNQDDLPCPQGQKDDDGKEENGHRAVLDGALKALSGSSDESNTNLFHVLMKMHFLDDALRVCMGVHYIGKMGTKKYGTMYREGEK